VTLGDLGAELLSRIDKVEKHSSRKQLEQRLSLLSQLHYATGALMEAPENRESVAQLASQFNFAHHCWRKHGVPIADATHVGVAAASDPQPRAPRGALGLDAGRGAENELGERARAPTSGLSPASAGVALHRIPGAPANCNGLHWALRTTFCWPVPVAHRLRTSTTRPRAHIMPPSP